MAGTSYADFIQSYDPLNSYNQGSGSGSYTVQGGETLQGIAQAVYGDASLWYKIAEVNGLRAGTSLSEGQRLNLPAGVSRNTYNADSLKAYDPSEAVGDLFPDAAKPPKKPKCGVFGQILVAVIALAVNVIVQTIVPIPVIGPILGQAAGSAVSQAFGVATKIQTKFSWKAVGAAAVTAGVGQLFGNSVLGAMATSAVSQGINTEIGLQDKFSWAGVAAAGVGAAAGFYVGGQVGGSELINRIAIITANAVANAATRSAINGESFGKNLVAAIPDVVANALHSAALSVVENLQRPGKPVGSENGRGPQLSVDPSVYGDTTVLGGSGGAGSGVTIQQPAAAVGSNPVARSSATDTESAAVAVVTAGGVVQNIDSKGASQNLGKFNVLLNDSGTGSFNVRSTNGGPSGTIEIVGNQGTEALTVTEFGLPSGFSEYRIENEVGQSMRLTDYYVRSNSMDMEARFISAESKAMRADAVNAMASGSIIAITPDISREISTSFFTSTKSGYELRDSAYYDWASGSHVKGGAEFIGSIGLRTLQAVQWGGFEIPVSLVRGNGFSPTPRDRQDAGVISFAAGGISGVSRRGGTLAAERTLPTGVQFEGTVFRLENPARVNTTFDVHAGNIASNHRYSGPGQGAVYGGTSPATALAEVQHYGLSAGRVSVSKDVQLGNVLDLTNRATRRELGVTLRQLTGDSYKTTQPIGNWARANGYDGILAPSARNRGGTNLVIFPGGNR